MAILKLTEHNIQNLPIQGQELLIVEDQFMVAIGMQKSLSEAGAKNVRIAGSVEDAHIALTQHHFDGVFLDIRLPDGLTFELAKDLVASGTPVVVHSGHIASEQLADVPEAIFCPKPSTPADILSALVEAQSLDNMSEEKAAKPGKEVIN